MPSAIDITKPIYGTPTTQSVRDNFHIARDEITALQDVADLHVNRAGDTMAGPLLLHGDPQANNEATTLSWVLRQLGSTVNTLVYVGEYDGATDIILSSNQAQFVVGTALPPALSQTSQFYFTVKTTKLPPGVGNQPVEGVTAGTFLLSNGVKWINYAMTAANVTAKTVPIDDPVIPNVPGLNVYDALAGIGQNFLLKSGGTLTNFLTLHAAPTADLHAATKKFVDDRIASLVFPGEAPTDGFSYARANSAWNNFPKFSKISIDTNTWNHISLNSSIASNTANQILGRKDNIIRWAVHVGNNAAGHDFDIWRYNDAGAAYDSIPVLSILRASGSMILRKDLSIDPPIAGAAHIFGRGPNNPTDPINDTLNIYSRGGVNSSVIGLRGPTFASNPNGIEFYTGLNYVKAWTFRQDGVLTTAGGITIPIANYLRLSSAANIVVDIANNFIFNGNADWRFWFNPADGSWAWDGYPNFTNMMYLTGGGALYTRSDIRSGGVIYVNTAAAGNNFAIYSYGNERLIRFTEDGWALRFNAATGLFSFTNTTGAVMFQCDVDATLNAGRIWSRSNLYALNDWTFYLGAGGSGRILNWTSNHYIDFATTTGTVTTMLGGTGFWVMRNDWWTYNNVGPVAGHGWIDLSDARAKENIEYVDDGLETILKLKPAKYRRLPPNVDESKMIAKSTRIPQEELGFIAQDVLDAIPYAVYETGMDLPNGEGGMDTDAPSLGIMTSNILAAAVNAIKELTARVITLEAASPARSKTQ